MKVNNQRSPKVKSLKKYLKCLAEMHSESGHSVCRQRKHCQCKRPGNQFTFNMAGRNVSFLKPETPSFIKKFKDKVGYKESATVETKFEESASSKLDDRELEDEKPTVVLGANVSEAEADAFITRLKAEEDASTEGNFLQHFTCSYTSNLTFNTLIPRTYTRETW